MKQNKIHLDKTLHIKYMIQFSKITLRHNIVAVSFDANMFWVQLTAENSIHTSYAD